MDSLGVVVANLHCRSQPDIIIYVSRLPGQYFSLLFKISALRTYVEMIIHESVGYDMKPVDTRNHPIACDSKPDLPNKPLFLYECRV